MVKIRFYLSWVVLLICNLIASAHDFEMEGIYYDIISETDLTVSVTYRGLSFVDYEDEYSGTVAIPTTVSYNSNTYRVASIGINAFRNCVSLTSIILPESVTSIGVYAFMDCDGLTSITIPTSVTSIGLYAFRGCNNLTSIKVEKGNTIYDSRNDCNAIIETSSNTLSHGCASTVIPEGVTSIGVYAFMDCDGLTSITIPASVTSIGINAFCGCSSLSTVTISEGVTSFEDGAFDSCSNLTSITIPASVTSIGLYAFRGCNNLTSIKVDKNNTTYDSRNDCNAIIRTSSNTLSRGFASTVIPEDVTSIGADAFAYCTGLTSITIPCNVEYLGTAAFRDCVNLTSITIHDGVTSIANHAFVGCRGLTSITLPESVTRIGICVFNGCDNLASIILPKGLTSIEYDTFTGCDGLTSITIPASVTSIATRAFISCENLTSIKVEKGNTIYDSRNDCNAIIETASNTLLYGCASTVIPESVKSIGYNAFACKGNLTSITIPDNVEYLSALAFQGCQSLSSIHIQGCPVIDPVGTFYGCINLKSITCESSVPLTFQTYGLAPADPPAPFGGVQIDECILYVPSEAIAAYKEAEYWKEFTNIRPIVKRNVEILDYTNSFAQVIDEECASITYTRTFNNTNWQAIYVPFEIPVSEEFLADFEVADLNDVRQYDRDDDGVKDETVIEAFKVKSGVLEANYPYLIRAREVGEKTITVTDATLFAAEENSIDCSSVREKFTFTGTYSRLSSNELPQGLGYYALSGGVWQPVAANASLGAFRFYLKVESRDGLNSTNKAIRMRIIGEDGTTEISELELSDNSQQSAVVYDLQGRRINDTSNLKGLYIVNGKKVMF